MKFPCLTPCLFVADTVLQFDDRLVALENKIDETLTESISILKQVTLSLFNICFATFPQIKKLLDHVLREGVIKNGYLMVRLTERVAYGQGRWGLTPHYGLGGKIIKNAKGHKKLRTDPRYQQKFC